MPGASLSTGWVGGEACGGDGAFLSAADGVSATPPGRAVVLNDDRFGFLGVADAGESAPDLLTGVVFFRAVVAVGVVVGSRVTVGEEVVGSGSESSPAEESPPIDVEPEVLLDVGPEVDVEPEVLLDVEPEVDVDPEVLPDVEPDESDEDADPASGSAHATPGVVATANPTPKATAKPPTRPIYLA